MLRVNQLAGFGHRRGSGSAMVAAETLGLTVGLKLCLDAGDLLSYPGSGQPWLDRSGNGTDFNRGTTSGSEASDPTFNGTAGRLSSGEYFSFDGGDTFTYDSANETWMQNLHKAGAKLTIIAVVKGYTLGSNTGICGQSSGNSGSVTGIGFRHRSSTNSTQFFVNNGTGGGAGSVLDKTPSGLVMGSASQWYVVAVSLDEAVGANGGFFFMNGAFETFASTYVSPASGDASFTMQIGAVGNSNLLPAAGSQMAMFLMWEGVALTVGQMQAFYRFMRPRFGI